MLGVRQRLERDGLAAIVVSAVADIGFQPLHLQLGSGFVFAVAVPRAPQLGC